MTLDGMATAVNNPADWIKRLLRIRFATTAKPWDVSHVRKLNQPSNVRKLEQPRRAPRSKQLRYSTSVDAIASVYTCVH